jgi:phage tail-like protein
MNVNGSRFHLLLGQGDWGACRTDAPKPAPLAPKWDDEVKAPEFPYWDEASKQLGLLPLDEPIPDTKDEPLFTAADHRDAAADRNGNLYLVTDDRQGLAVRSAGDGRVTPFWPAAPRRRARRGGAAFADAAPAPAAAAPFAGLAVTCGDFLVAGTRDALLRFDLVGGGAPERAPLPDGAVAAALAAAPDGGLWLLDAKAPRLLKLDRELCLETRKVSDGPPVFAPDGEDPGETWRAEPIAIDLAALPAPAALAALADGSLILLDAPLDAAGALHILDPGAAVLRELLVLKFTATCFTVEKADGETPTLLVADAGGNQARRIALAMKSGLWQADALPDTLPLRRFGGRALVAIQGKAYYDSGPKDPLWVRIVEVRHRRFARSAGFVTPIFDGGVPQCLWDKLRIDGCIPAGAAVRIEARANDDRAALASAASSGWAAQPPLVLSPSGPELPGKRAVAEIATDAAAGKGNWGLLLQNLVGRYAQLRITLGGDERVTPRLRALRLWYPRFSWAERFLPGLYREEPASASFLDRFLANFEGVDTAIEDRIATIETLFDPRIAPVGMLDWLAGWYEVALDPSWDERRRRLFIANAARFFGWRGTIRGLQLALKLAMDAKIGEADFALEGPERPAPKAVRIVEAWRSRAPGRAFPPPAPAMGPGIHSLADDWLPEEGSAGLWARWPGHEGTSGRFPLFPPGGDEAGWTALVQRQFGFVPVLGQGERARWLAFQISIGTPSPQADVPVAASEDWQRYAGLPSPDRAAWQEFLAGRHCDLDALNAAHDSQWDELGLVPLPDHLPATAAAARDWLAFEGREIPVARAAHRFTVLLPRTRADADPDAEAYALALARRIVGLEKPAHTVFDVRFYWAMNRVGEARLGLDSAIGQGSRAPELIPGAVLGRAYVGAAFVGGPDAPPRGRERVQC